jgi:hypothetical protein
MGFRTTDMMNFRKDAAGMDFGQMQSVFAPYLRLPENFGGAQRQRVVISTI